MSEREEDILIESLNSADEETRRQAIELLGELRLKKAVPKIAELVNSENWRIRKSIVEAYKKIDDDSCLPLLQKLIKDSNVEVHSTAIDAMVYYGDRAIPYLLPLLKDDDEDARILSANVLGFMRSAKGVKSLIERLKVEDSMNVRYAIIEALGYIGNEEAIDYLLELLEKEDMYLKIVIIEALGKIGSLRACVVIMSLLEDELLRSVCIDALGNIGAEISINTIIEYFNSDDDTNVRVVIAIGKIYSKHINNQSYAVLIKEICKQFFKKKERYDKLLELLKNDNIELRNSVLLILSWIDELKLTKELMELLANEDYTEKIKDLFIRLGDRVLDDLYNEINKTDNYEIRKAIIQIIGLIGNSREIELLMKMLDNENERGYYDVIISSLGWLQAECSVEKLEKLLNEE
ncbi:MAG TPA: HEAT repeat domain-containing protein, partial [bacterium]|nr:HEAT repeat domain-containing protein [bacterium]